MVCFGSCLEFGLREDIGEGIKAFSLTLIYSQVKRMSFFGPAIIHDQWIDLRSEIRYWQTMSKHRVNSKHCQDGQQPDDKRTRTTSTLTSWVITSSSSSMGRCHSFLSSDWLFSAKKTPYWLINSEGQSEISCHNTMSTICLRHRQSRHLYLSSKWVESLHLVLLSSPVPNPKPPRPSPNPVKSSQNQFQRDWFYPQLYYSILTLNFDG